MRISTVRTARCFSTSGRSSSIAPFKFSTSPSVVFGSGASKELKEYVKDASPHVLVVTGKNGCERYRDLIASLGGVGGRGTFIVGSEPTVDQVRMGAHAAWGCKAVVGIGGGAVLDAAKAIAALVPNGGEPLDFLEVVGRGKKMTKASLAYIAVPTTFGTGAEVTMNAVLKSAEHGVKASLRSPWMIPTVALVDPDLGIGTPRNIIASTGLDALCQNVEPFLSNKANPVTDALSREGIRRAARSLRAYFDDSNNQVAREDMAMASLLGGMALANAKLGAVHGFAGVIGGMYDSAPHGAICAALMPGCFAANVDALAKDPSKAEAVERHMEVARLLTGRSDARIEDGVDFLRRLAEDLGVPKLSSYGLQRAHFDEVVKKSKVASSMQGNPVMLSDDALHRILASAS